MSVLTQGVIDESVITLVANTAQQIALIAGVQKVSITEAGTINLYVGSSSVDTSGANAGLLLAGSSGDGVILNLVDNRSDSIWFKSTGAAKVRIVQYGGKE